MLRTELLAWCMAAALSLASPWGWFCFGDGFIWPSLASFQLVCVALLWWRGPGRSSGCLEPQAALAGEAEGTLALSGLLGALSPLCLVPEEQPVGLFPVLVERV